MRIGFFAAFTLLAQLALVAPAAAERLVRHWNSWDQPCNGDCSVMFFGGPFVATGMQVVFLEGKISPTSWDFGESGLLGVTAARRVATIFRRFDVEAELGAARRFGSMDESEVWGALFFRYDLPWDEHVRTSLALSTGLNYATGVSEEEQEISKDGSGARLLHYLAPEVTFALPRWPDTELVFRFHHRSGAFGLVSDIGAGAQFATIGIRHRF